MVVTTNVLVVTPEESFGVITNEKMKKNEFLNRLFSAVLHKKLMIYFVRRKPNFWEWIRFRKIHIFSCKDIAVYSLENSDKMLVATKLIMSCKLWHPTTFHLIIADSAYRDVLINFCRSSMSIMEYEIAHKESSYCTIEFVDDDAFFFGAAEAKAYFLDVFPEIERV